MKKFRTPPCEPQLLIWLLTFGTHPPAVCFLTITIIKVLCADLFWWSQQRDKGFLGGCSHNSITVLIGQCYKPGLAKFHQNILQNREIRSYFAKYLHFDMGGMQTIWSKYLLPFELILKISMTSIFKSTYSKETMEVSMFLLGGKFISCSKYMIHLIHLTHTQQTHKRDNQKSSVANLAGDSWHHLQIWPRGEDFQKWALSKSWQCQKKCPKVDLKMRQ